MVSNMSLPFAANSSSNWNKALGDWGCSKIKAVPWNVHTRYSNYEED
jgi:hypothetical protein